MGLFGKLFEKKNCDICGGDIGLLGNRKLEDGNLCKNCANKLSPWFSDRRSSTVAQIREQLDYREKNREEVSKFHTTLTLGDHTKILFDEDNRKFMVTSARNLAEANPDVLEYSQVTGCRVDTDEHRSELKRKDSEGKEVSFNPPRYEYRYDFYVVINVNHPYFDEIRFKLNNNSGKIAPPPTSRFGMNSNSGLSFAKTDMEFQNWQQMGNEIVKRLTDVRQQTRDEIEAANAPKTAVTCPFCGATTIPDAQGRCEFCGGSVNG